MLNYIWGGMIILSFCFALFQDLRDELSDRWKNQEAIQLDWIGPEALQENPQRVRLLIDASSDTLQFAAIRKNESLELAIPIQEHLPNFWKEKAEFVASKTASGQEVMRVRLLTKDGKGYIQLPEVHWVKMRAITNAAIDMAETAVTLALGLVGVMAFWLGLMQIGYASGMINGMNKVVAPLMRKLFPEVPADHPAMSAISMNMAANVLGLGNAATPLGIKAMEELQKLNPNKEQASNAMCMFLAINTSSVQLLPPATLVALIGAGTNQLMIPIILATLISTTVAIIAGKWFSRTRDMEVVS